MSSPFLTDLPCRLCIPKKQASIFDDSGDATATRAEVHRIVNSFMPEELHSASLEIVGHQSGVPRQYPQSPDKIRRRAGTATPVLPTVDTMDVAFESIGVDAIEMDVQVVAGGDSDGEVYVMHDRPTVADLADDVVGPYLSGNRLTTVLEAFAARHYEQGKKIYLEYKTYPPMGELAETDLGLIERTMAIVDEVAIASGSQADMFRSQIGFVSFNDRALKRARDLTQASGHSFHFIAGTSRPICSLLAGLIDETCLDGDTIERLRSASWLTGIWFGPGWVPDYGTVFPAIDEGWDRKLGYGIGPYYTSARRFRHLMGQEDNRHLNSRMTSVIMELVGSSVR
jgi:hypothetical protein